MDYRADQQNRCEPISVLALFSLFDLGPIIRQWTHYLFPSRSTTSSGYRKRGSTASIEPGELGDIVHWRFNGYSPS